MEQLAPDLRVINLETAVTAGGSPLPGKGIHYRMHPAHLASLQVARIDACASPGSGLPLPAGAGERRQVWATAGAGLRRRCLQLCTAGMADREELDRLLGPLPAGVRIRL